MAASSSTSSIATAEDETMWEIRCEMCIRCHEVQDCQQCEQCLIGKKCMKRRCLSARLLYAKKCENDRKQALKAEKEKAKAALAAAQEKKETVRVPEKRKRGRKKGATAAVKAQTKSDHDLAAQLQSTHLRPKVTRQSLQLCSSASSSPNKKTLLERQKPKQCFAPDCLRQANPDSKYCSENCGEVVAKMRLVEVLPSRIKEYFSGPRTHEKEMARRHASLRKEFEGISANERQLIKFIDRVHDYVQEISSIEPEKREEKEEEDMYMACVVCGQPDVSARKYAKHVETCWVKLEKSVSYGAAETRHDPDVQQMIDRIFCENYDKKQKTYCKRLKSMCPEHRKPGIEQCLKICGYPKKWEDSECGSITIAELIESDDPFGRTGCTLARAVCSKHNKWIPTTMGMIELEQANLLYKKYEMLNEAAKLKCYSMWCNNVANIIVHQKSTGNIGSIESAKCDSEEGSSFDPRDTGVSSGTETNIPAPSTTENIDMTTSSRDEEKSDSRDIQGTSGVS